CAFPAEAGPFLNSSTKIAVIDAADKGAGSREIQILLNGKKTKATAFGTAFLDGSADPGLLIDWLTGERKNGDFLAIVDADAKAGIEISKNLVEIMKFTRLRIDIVRIGDLDGIHPKLLDGYDSILLAVDSLWKIPENSAVIPGIREFVENGGGIAAAVNFEDERLKDLFGIDSYRALIKNAQGIEFTGDFVAGSSGVKINGDDFSSDSFDVKLKRTAAVYARAGTSSEANAEGIPLLWTYGFGKGRSVYWNDMCLMDKAMRGFLLQTMLKTTAATVVPIVNGSVVYIDDCPQPMWDVLKEPIKSEFDMTDTQFYMNVWLQDMIKLAKDFGIRITAGILFSYDDKVKEPFDINQFKTSSDGASIKLAKKINEAGFEIALHGYNHQSFTIRESELSKGWESKDQMISALKLVRDEWKNVLPPGTPFPKVYIAPNNLISRMGREAITGVFPEITAIASQYLDENEIEGQEFEFDPALKNIVDIPRLSSEYFLASFNFLEVLNGLNLYGIFSHFVHPDDVYDPERAEEMNWSGLLSKTRDMFAFLKTNYPFLRPMFAGEFAEEIRQFLNMKFDAEKTGDSIKIKMNREDGKPGYFMIAFSGLKKPVRLKGCEEIYRNSYTGHAYFKMTGKEAEIGLIEKSE
ncbi:MAG: DUF2194 domain-containing protein, partial [Deltaproteobacteria bacterium]|nr:DUF2194 domain-containing protein [Deltaproteobacteria bacterium]